MNDIFSNLFFFVVTTGLTCLIPGVTAMTVAKNGANYGGKSVLSTIYGIVLANTIFFILVGIGAKTFIDKAPTIYKIIQIIGVTYMIYLGVCFIKSRNKHDFMLIDKKENMDYKKIYLTTFKQGFYIQASNPKAFLYFLALLPQFIIPTQSILTQLISFCTITAFLDLFAYSLYGYLGTIIKKYELIKVNYYLKLLTGIILVILGSKFLISNY